MTELTRIMRMTGVKKSDVRSPTARPFCAVISATSPLFIIPVPMIRDSCRSNPSILAQPPHPITFPIRATSVKQMLKRMSLTPIEPKLVFSPIPAKKTGAKIIYELMSTRLSM